MMMSSVTDHRPYKLYRSHPMSLNKWCPRLGVCIFLVLSLTAQNDVIMSAKPSHPGASGLNSTAAVLIFIVAHLAHVGLHENYF